MQSEQFQLHADVEEQHWWFVARRRILRRLANGVLPPSPQHTVLDVGCGTGANIAELSADYACLGIDTSAEAIELARRRFPRVEFLTGRAPEALGDRMRRVRLLLLTDVLEHVPDDFAMLSELLAATVPGTLVLLTVPADESLWSPHDESFGHYRRYDRPRLERLWTDLPVRPRLLSYFNARTYPLVRAVRAWNRLRGRAAGRAGTDFWVPAAPWNRLLTRLFFGEVRVLEEALGGRRRRGYGRGTSLVAILEREKGPLAIRPWPADVPPDRHAVRASEKPDSAEAAGSTA